MKTMAANRDAAVNDMRETLAAITAGDTRIEIYRACEQLSSQALWLRDMVAHTTSRRGALYPEHDWEFYRNAIEEQHGRPA
jgi:hypothetical protein